MSVRAFTLAGALVLLVHVLFSVVVFWELPDQLPQHFDVTGAPKRFVETSASSWFLLPAIALATWGMITAVAHRLPSHPEWFNFPEKARFLALPADYRAPVVKEMRSMLGVANMLVAVLMLVIQLMMWQQAVHGSAGPLAPLPLGLSALLVPVMLVWLVRLRRAMVAAEQRVARDRRSSERDGQHGVMRRRTSRHSASGRDPSH